MGRKGQENWIVRTRLEEEEEAKGRKVREPRRASEPKTRPDDAARTKAARIKSQVR